MKKLTTIDFIIRAKEVHGDKYDYSKVEYVNNKTKVCIICPEHGEFWQRPAEHLDGHHCKKCSKLTQQNGKKITTNDIILKAKEVHGDKYDYSKTNYIDSKTKITVTCPIHGDFKISVYYLLKGYGCHKCNKKRKTTEQFINECKIIHGDKYDYSKTDYCGSDAKVIVICPIHGEFVQQASKHLNGAGCPICAKKIKTNIIKNNFIERAKEIHGDKYDYSETEYDGWNKLIKIYCKKDKKYFFQKGGIHLSGAGCPICQESKLEKTVENFLKQNNIIYDREKTFIWLKYKNNLSLDFYLPEYNIAIECQGMQHFKEIDFFGGKKSFSDVKKRDKIKQKLCYENDIKILYYTNINYNEFLGEKLIKNEIDLIKEIKGE